MSKEKKNKVGRHGSDDLELLREIVEKDDSFTGVGHKDVDWLLRDVAPNISVPVERGSHDNHKDEDEMAKGRRNSESYRPDRQSSIVNANASDSRQRSLSMSQLTRLRTESSLENVPDDAASRRASLPHINNPKKESLGGFFSKLKGKLSRNKAHASNNQSLFKDNYNMGGPELRSSLQNEDSELSKSSSLNSGSSVAFSYSGNDIRSVENRIMNLVNYYRSGGTNRTSSLGHELEYGRLQYDRSSPSSSYSSDEIDKKVDKNSEISQLKSFLTRLYGAGSSHLQEDKQQSKKQKEPNACHRLKRVGFHCLTLTYDPPQQLPSRHPRKGNVEIFPNGERKVHPLSKEDRLSIENDRMGKSGGVIIGGLSTKKDSESPSENEDDDVKIDEHAKQLGIERPLMSHKDKYRAPEEKMQLDTMYERCCHLREILPLPSILKQIPKGTMDPIPLLQIKNPVPTMIEIESFADFIRIAPILCLSFDGVELTSKQFEILLSAISAKRYLQKLSLRNTKIDKEGWRVLCYYLSRNRRLKSLDLTQVPNLHVNVSTKKHSKKNSIDNTERMDCDTDNRSDMDWELIIAALIVRGGIEELVLTGCRIKELSVFDRLISMGALIKTKILGVAGNDLSSQQFSVLVKKYLFLPFVQGLDLGFNDFTDEHLGIILDYTKQSPSKLEQSQLLFLSLNNTNIQFSKTFRSFFENVIMVFPLLKYLDLSNNSKLFSMDDNVPNESIESIKFNSQNDIMKYFTSKFPLFRNLYRLQIDNNELDPSSLVQIANVMPFCKKLKYLSVVGNKLDLTSATALVIGLRNSRELFLLDGDFEGLPAFFKDNIRVYSFRNMEHILFKEEMDNGNEFLNSQKSSDTNLSKSGPRNPLSKQLSDILSEKAKNGLDINSPNVKSFVERAKLMRQKLNGEMKKISRLLQKGNLGPDKKETFLKYFFLDLSIQRGLELIDVPQIDKSLIEPSEFLKAKLSAEGEDKEYNADEDVDSDEVSIANHLLVSDMSQSGLDFSKDNLSDFTEQEGGSLRKLSKIKDDFDQQLNTDIFQDLLGKEINNRILHVDIHDLDKTINFLGQLRRENYSYKDVMKMSEDPSSDMDEAIRRTIKILYHGYDGGDDNDQDTNDESDHEKNNQVDQKNAINAAYDETLKHFHSE